MEEVRTHGDTQFQRDISGLATEFEGRPPVDVPKVLQPSTRRRLYWIAGLLSPVVLGAIGVAILWQWNPAVGVPVAPAGIVAVFEQNPCALRMVHIMTAISAYRAQRGAAPHALAELVPGFLSEPVVDPASGQPYGYQQNGESVVLVCPNAERHVPADHIPPS